MIAAINNQSIVMLAIGCAAILALAASSSRYRSSLLAYIVAGCGLMILAWVERWIEPPGGAWGCGYGGIRDYLVRNGRSKEFLGLVPDRSNLTSTDSH
ncbi:MAG: hypothetical protein M3Y58_22390 [Chloroflexota bacterium]|nr:hypothetical protein [Chloroflexota bacterium]